jgi:hypothetical protein
MAAPVFFQQKVCSVFKNISFSIKAVSALKPILQKLPSFVTYQPVTHLNSNLQL